MKKGDKWLMGEITLYIRDLTPEGRDTIVSWLRATAEKIERKKCSTYVFEQPERKFKLKVGR